MLKASLLVITYNRCDHAIQCLTDLGEQSFQPKEIILVDNASSDGTVAAVKSRFPNVVLIESPENLGVGGARNLGIKSATGDIVIVIDDDARFAEPDACEKALAEFELQQNLGVLAFCILSSANGSLETRAIPKVDKRHDALSDGECAYFTGAGFAIRREVFEKVGPFWAELFYVGEELDLSYRLLAADYSIQYRTDIQVLHDATPAARPSGQYIYFNTRNRVWIALRNLPWPYVATMIVTWWGYMALNAIRNMDLRPFLRGMWDSVKSFPAVTRLRVPIQPGVVTRVRGLSGRLWY